MKGNKGEEGPSQQKYCIVFSEGTVGWMDTSELLRCCTQVSELPWKVSVVIHHNSDPLRAGLLFYSAAVTKCSVHTFT